MTRAGSRMQFDAHITYEKWVSIKLRHLGCLLHVTSPVTYITADTARQLWDFEWRLLSFFFSISSSNFLVCSLLPRLLHLNWLMPCRDSVLNLCRTSPFATQTCFIKAKRSQAMPTANSEWRKAAARTHTHIPCGQINIIIIIVDSVVGASRAY